MITSQVEGMGILHGIDKADIFEFIKSAVGDTEELSYSKKILGEVEVDLAAYLYNNTAKLRASSQINSKHIIPIAQNRWRGGTVVGSSRL